MQYARLATRLYNTPLLITPEKAEVIESIFRAHVEGNAEALPKPEAQLPSQWMLAGPVPLRPSDAGYGVADGGIAVIRVHGTLVQRTGWLDALSGITGYDKIAAQLAAANADPNVRGILLDIDSPGGEAAGAFDLAEYIRYSKKKLYAISNEMALSAGYAIASAAHKLYMPTSAVVGSVGVIMMHIDTSQSDAKRGVVFTPIYSGSRKADFNSHAPLSSAGRASAQALCDQLYGVFVDAVATARGINADVVRRTEAALLSPQAAIDLGMADGIATYADVIQMLTDEVSKVSFFGLSAASSVHQLKETSMSAEQDKAVAEARAQAFAEGKAEGTKEGQAAGHAEGVKAGASSERARIKAILQCEEAKERPNLAGHLALDTDMSAEQAAAMLGKAATETPTATGNPLAEAMSKVPNPVVGTDTGAVSTSATRTINPEAIYASRAEARHA